MKNKRNSKSCPKCGKENPDDARYCNACGCVLSDIRVDVKVNSEAIISFISALIALGCFVPGLIAAMDRRVLDPRSDMVENIACVSIAAGGIAVLFGILALCRIGSSGGRQVGYGFAAIGTAIPPILIFMLASFNIGRWGPHVSYSMICGTNLSGIGKAMFIYSQDYNDKLPIAGGIEGRWVARLPWWAANNRENAYGLSDPNATDGRASISASLYLLIKYCEVKPKSFVCREDFGTTEFKPSEYGLSNINVTDLWDFGPEPPRHCSYAHHIPYGPYALDIFGDPALAVAADRNPWMDSPFVKAKTDFNKFDPDGGTISIKVGNAVTHQGDGQNVLFLDNHVGFEKRSFCGVNDDNIYTYWDGSDIRRGTPPKLGSQPADRTDSLLVNDPAIPR